MRSGLTIESLSNFSLLEKSSKEKVMAGRTSGIILLCQSQIGMAVMHALDIIDCLS